MQLESGYKAYILRVWQVEREDQPTLVAALEDCRTNERQTFANLTELLEFLECGRVSTATANGFGHGIRVNLQEE